MVDRFLWCFCIKTSHGVCSDRSLEVSAVQRCHRRGDPLCAGRASANGRPFLSPALSDDRAACCSQLLATLTFISHEPFRKIPCSVF